MKKIVLTCLVALMVVGGLVGCGEKPIREFYVYETTTSDCYKVQEMKDAYNYWLIDCRSVPDNAKEYQLPDIEQLGRARGR